MKNGTKSRERGWTQSNNGALDQLFLSVVCCVAFLGLLKPVTLLAATSFQGTNSARITINDYTNTLIGPPTPSTPYQSTIDVTGLAGTVAHVSVTLWGLY